MSVTRQILLSLLLVAFVAAGWLVYLRRDLVIVALGGTPPADATAAGAGPGAGPRPGGGAPPPGGVAGRPGGSGPVQVVAAPVEIDSVGTELRAIGTAAAVRSVTVYPQVTGVVAEVDFTSGGTVTAGQVILRLDSSDQQVAVDKAGLALDAARQAVERAQRLSKSGNVSAVTLSDAQTAEKQAEIDLRSAELELAKRTIHAPFGGTVGLSDLSIGDLVSSAKAITTIDDMSAVTVAFDIPESAAGKLAIGQAVGATSAALPGETLSGTVSALDSRIDPASRTLRVEARVDNQRGLIRPGMGITILLSIPGEPRPAVPSLAIQWDRQGSFVWKLVDGKVRRTPVQVVGRRSGMVTVAGEVGAGDRVVTEGVLRLREGMSVAAETAPAAAPPSAPQPAGTPAASASSADSRS
ncbi:MAG TPA: efflux RND transporter periplasmic adaptor subunit [Bauldia sp.]|nr:efflux RND transporter periplasmic adaptor subunit [Bauldia sp.]